MPASDTCVALNALLAEYFTAPLARVFVMTTLSRLDLDPTLLTPEAMPRVVRSLAGSLPSYLSDPQRRAECLSRLMALSPDGVAETSRVAPLPTAPSRPPPGPRSRRPPPAAPAAVPSASGGATVVRVQSPEDVVLACDAVRELARRVGFPQVMENKISAAVAELARNLQLHAKGGEVHMNTIGEPPRGVEVVALDKGPGITHLDHVLNGKQRSKTGMGLRGARKLMDTFDITSSPAGTRVVVRKYLA